MCGIYGSTIAYNENQIKKKLERTSFRGPDKLDWKTIFLPNGSLSLGHNRLSIIDLDARSNQPFSYNNQIEIVFNGEIYNFKQLKKSLKSKGYDFKTTSDTEVICAAYLHYGQRCVEHLNGMFAFVLFDRKKLELFGARDRLGQKPFYYYHNGLNFEFSSQISSIQMFNKRLSISNQSILEYLKWGAIPDPMSIYNEITKLKPGHYFTYDITTGALGIKKYWDIDYKNNNTYTGTYAEAKEKLEALLKDAVESRMYADVPLGVFLSGGVDSSIIAALATKTFSNKVKTFSVKFDEKGFDESLYAQKVADHLHTDHHIIKCNYEEGLGLISNFHHFYDEPFADPSAIPSMLLAKHTKRHVTVALSGDAGDESFIGYNRYMWIKQNRFLFLPPDALRKFAGRAIGILPNRTLKSISKGLLHKNIEHLYLANLTNIDLSWINHQWMPSDILEKDYLFHSKKNLLERISDFDLKAYLNWHINTKVDRATMAFSLEARSPLMDHRIVEFARSLPTDFKFKGREQKRILKDLLYDHVPRKIFQRPKTGFAMPFEEWFRNELKDMVLSELNEEGLRQIPGIDPIKVKEAIDDHMKLRRNKYPMIWKLLVLKQWLSKNSGGTSLN